MPLPSFLRRKKTPAAPSPESPTAGAPAVVEKARTRARRRLIGAVVLLGVGVIAFPLLFETEPRPIPVDLPIEIPKRDGAPPLAMPSAPATTSSTGPSTTAAAPSPDEPVASAPARAEPPPAAPAEKPAAAAKVEKAEEPPAPPPAAPKPAADEKSAKADKAEPARKPDDGARAKALLEGKTAAAPAPAERYVVQIGAFSSSRTVDDVRAKAQKAGLDTFTQVVKVASGEATRVRVGPFPSREQADAAAAKVRKAGLPATVLKL